MVFNATFNTILVLYRILLYLVTMQNFIYTIVLKNNVMNKSYLYTVEFVYNEVQGTLDLSSL
jgi:hypothetical protein